jgi:hypothetical protein
MQMSKRRISHFCPDHLLSKRGRTAKTSVQISPSSSKKITPPAAEFFLPLFFVLNLKITRRGCTLIQIHDKE